MYFSGITINCLHGSFIGIEESARIIIITDMVVHAIKAFDTSFKDCLLVISRSM